MNDTELTTHIIDLKQSQARTQATLDTLSASLTARLDNQDSRLNSHSDRLHSVERGSWYRTGAFAVAAAVGVWVLNKLGVTGGTGV